MNEDTTSRENSKTLPRVLIVAPNASTQMGGESFLPVQYFRALREQGCEVWLLCHRRNREDLRRQFPAATQRIYTIPDVHSFEWLRWILSVFPRSFAVVVASAIQQIFEMRIQRRWCERIIPKHGINVVHQPAPVSPKQCSLIFDLGVPVIIGPMNGGMTFPPLFRQQNGCWERLMVGTGRLAANSMHYLLPGKRRAALLLVANQRTLHALPSSVQRTPTRQLVENGVYLPDWPSVARSKRIGPARFVYIGALAGWKHPDYLLEAFAQVVQAREAFLDLVGRGEDLPQLRAFVEKHGIADRVKFHGFQPHSKCAEILTKADALVLPSLYECGGAVVLEAMAMRVAVIATAWGGPLDYVSSETGILIPPDGREQIITGLRDAMLKLIDAPEACRQMGEAGRRRVEAEFSWSTKAVAILGVYKNVIAGTTADLPNPIPLSPTCTSQ